MDRISALRNVEDALREFESGEVDLATAERQVLAVLRTYATEFEGEDGDLAAYRAVGDDRVDGVVVVADSETEAEERVRDLLVRATEGTNRGSDTAGENLAEDETPEFEVERLS